MRYFCKFNLIFIFFYRDKKNTPRNSRCIFVRKVFFYNHFFRLKNHKTAPENNTINIIENK